MSRLVYEENAYIKIQDIENITKKTEIFFNPEMKFNRDISCLVLAENFKSTIKKKKYTKYAIQ